MTEKNSPGVVTRLSALLLRVVPGGQCAALPRSLLLDRVEEVLAVPGVRRESGWPLPLCRGAEAATNVDAGGPARGDEGLT